MSLFVRFCLLVSLVFVSKLALGNQVSSAEIQSGYNFLRLQVNPSTAVGRPLYDSVSNRLISGGILESMEFLVMDVGIRRTAGQRFQMYRILNEGTFFGLEIPFSKSQDVIVSEIQKGSFKYDKLAQKVTPSFGQPTPSARQIGSGRFSDRRIGSGSVTPNGPLVNFSRDLDVISSSSTPSYCSPYNGSVGSALAGIRWTREATAYLKTAFSTKPGLQVLRDTQVDGNFHMCNQNRTLSNFNGPALFWSHLFSEMSDYRAETGFGAPQSLNEETQRINCALIFTAQRANNFSNLNIPEVLDLQSMPESLENSVRSAVSDICGGARNFNLIVRDL